ncbi:sterol desaturase family protein [Flavitalea sp. BT771]|uniref:sterol desaturase family protein n=1 Tax=Flavitalea sp. BT771 TaxID=3063329 RepID=UPI0026E1B127|nr:sterol desaturase family protein [Flavitalea sp. BT771]MDO6430773.1 sterol desaturase family protein [Flavitalea sp. BT771]MDV6219087.1 sterol desaturase family protein [Flavitalea sp. BT771]
MDRLLEALSGFPDVLIWMIFLLENILLTCMVLYAGGLILRRSNGESYLYTKREWLICGVTNVLNTVVTYMGFWLWQRGLIGIRFGFSWMVLADFLILFLSMDLLMYLFHLIIHKTFLYGMIHRLHHAATDPQPMDLFILHPVETVSFGGMWLVLLMLHPFNMYAIIIYLTVNLVFGLIGHLGMEPLPAGWRETELVRCLGSSTFHHDHHQDVEHNFGFYTTVWDRLFRTLKR